MRILQTSPLKSRFLDLSKSRILFCRLGEIIQRLHDGFDLNDLAGNQRVFIEVVDRA